MRDIEEIQEQLKKIDKDVARSLLKIDLNHAKAVRALFLAMLSIEAFLTASSFRQGGYLEGVIIGAISLFVLLAAYKSHIKVERLVELSKPSGKRQ